MTLLDFVTKLGLNKAAKRLGITVGTLRSWLKHGPSERGATKVALKIKRHLIGVRSWDTNQRAKRFRETIAEPKTARDIPAIESVPKRPPELSPEVQRYKRTEKLLGTEIIGDGPKSRTRGTLTWVQIGQDVRDVDTEDLASAAWMIHDASGMLWCSVKVLFMRFIPFNPKYTGEMLAKQGKWHDTWMTTPAVSGIETLRRDVYNLFEKSLRWAETRVIFCEMMGVATFNYKLKTKPT